MSTPEPGSWFLIKGNQDSGGIRTLGLVYYNMNLEHFWEPKSKKMFREYCRYVKVVQKQVWKGSWRGSTILLYFEHSVPLPLNKGEWGRDNFGVWNSDTHSAMHKTGKQGPADSTWNCSQRPVITYYGKQWSEIFI